MQIILSDFGSPASVLHFFNALYRVELKNAINVFLKSPFD
jgi:hypothetical protein